MRRPPGVAMCRKGAARITRFSASSRSRSCVNAKPRSTNAPSPRVSSRGSGMLSNNWPVIICSAGALLHVVEKLLAIYLAVAHVVHADLAHGRAAAALHRRIHHRGHAEPVARDHGIAHLVVVHRLDHFAEGTALLQIGRAHV